LTRGAGDDLRTVASRFADLSEDELEEILNKTESRNTKNVIQVASKLFEDYKNNKLNLCRDDL
jgi:biotin synthase-like enzyme